MFSILSLGIKIEHSYWNCTEFYITLKQPMSEIHGKIISTRIKDNKRVGLIKKSIFSAFLTLVALEF
jgi:hypothetical protein